MLLRKRVTKKPKKISGKIFGEKGPPVYNGEIVYIYQYEKDNKTYRIRHNQYSKEGYYRIKTRQDSKSSYD